MCFSFCQKRYLKNAAHTNTDINKGKIKMNEITSNDEDLSSLTSQPSLTSDVKIS